MNVYSLSKDLYFLHDLKCETYRLSKWYKYIQQDKWSISWWHQDSGFLIWIDYSRRENVNMNFLFYRKKCKFFRLGKKFMEAFSDQSNSKCWFLFSYLILFPISTFFYKKWIVTVESPILSWSPNNVWKHVISYIQMIYMKYTKRMSLNVIIMIKNLLFT